MSNLRVFYHSVSEYLNVGSFYYPEAVVAVDSYPSWHFTSQVRQWKELVCFICSGSSGCTKCSGKLLQCNYVGMVSLVCDQLSGIPVVIWCQWPYSQQWLCVVFPLLLVSKPSQNTWTLRPWTHSMGNPISLFEEKTWQLSNPGKIHQATTQGGMLSLTFSE